jgi:hypothetical protein
MNPCANCTPRESHASITWCSTSRKDLEGKDKGQEEEIKEGRWGNWSKTISQLVDLGTAFQFPCGTPSHDTCQHHHVTSDNRLALGQCIVRQCKTCEWKGIIAHEWEHGTISQFAKTSHTNTLSALQAVTCCLTSRSFKHFISLLTKSRMPDKPKDVLTPFIPSIHTLTQTAPSICAAHEHLW